MIVKRIHENLGVEDGALRFLGIWDTVLEEKMAVTPHVHENVEEVYYIMEGRGEMRIGEEEKIVEEGDLVYIPPREIHSLIQVGSKPLRFITIRVVVSGMEKPRPPPYIV
ncbi:MAG: cupin domain-containing protein [Candidatus Geothermarchaeales archaeon]